MPWCPNCKTEYREGISVCADCGAALVAELDAASDSAMLCLIKNGEAAEKLKDYLIYAGINAKSEYIPDENSYSVTVPEADIKKAQVEYKAFLTVENEAFKASADAEDQLDVELSESEDGTVHETIQINSIEDLEKLKAAGISEDELERQFKKALKASAYKPAGVYESQADKANELSSTGYTFLIAGSLMLIFVLLNFFNVIGLLYGEYLTLGVLTALALAGIVVGINAFQRAKKASAKSVEEEKFTSEFNKWLDDHAYIMTSGHLDGSDGTSEEILYLERTDAMKKAIESCFGPLDEDFVDSMLDKLYDRTFGE